MQFNSSSLSTNLTERQVRFLLDGHNHDGRNSAMIPQLLNKGFVPQAISSSIPTVNGGVRPATVVLAAIDSSDNLKATADIVCTGSEDQFSFNQAISNLNGGPGTILLLPGNYNFFGTSVPIDLTGQAYISIEGCGPNTVLNLYSEGSFIALPSQQPQLRNLTINLVASGSFGTTPWVGGFAVYDNVFFTGLGHNSPLIEYSTGNVLVNNCTFNASDTGGTQNPAIQISPGFPFTGFLQVLNSSFQDNVINFNSLGAHDYGAIISNNFFTSAGLITDAATNNLENTLLSNNIFYNMGFNPIQATGSLILNNMFNLTWPVELLGRDSFIGNTVIMPKIRSSYIVGTRTVGLDFITNNYINAQNGSDRNHACIFLGETGVTDDIEIVINNWLTGSEGTSAITGGPLDIDYFSTTFQEFYINFEPGAPYNGTTSYTVNDDWNFTG